VANLSQLRACAVIAALGLLAAAGCGSGADRTSDRGAVERVTERDFSISAPARVPAGPVTVEMHNTGPDSHEMLLVRGRARDLPLRRDGLTVDEDKIDSRLAGILEGTSPGATSTLHVRLSPGRYVVLCNMSGHFKGGMKKELVVS
jgi:hypothetical protein